MLYNNEEKFSAVMPQPKQLQVNFQGTPQTKTKHNAAT
jgi:hypothetical protein